MTDAGDPDDETMWDMSLTPQRVLKPACLYEIDGLEDCAAELLCKEPTVFRFATEFYLREQ